MLCGFFGLSHLKRNCVKRSHYRIWMSLKLSCTVQFHFLKAECFHFKEAPVFVSELRVGVRKMLLQLTCLHGSIREGFKTNDTLGQLLITSLYESESIVEKSIDIFSLSFWHIFLRNWKFNLTKYSSLCSTLTLTIHLAILAHTTLP